MRALCISQRIALFVLFSAVLGLFAAPAHAQTAYTSDTSITDFTAKVSSYASISNYSNMEGGCASPAFTPTADELATTGCRVYNGGPLTGLPGSNWIEATFSSPVSSIIVFPSIDHYGFQYDGYQYTIYGSNDGSTWTLLFDATGVQGDGEPFTLGTFTGTPPSTVNNVLTPQSVGLAPGCSGTPGVPCAIGYIATFQFATAYQYYAFGPSSIAVAQQNADQELSAVGAARAVTQTIPTDSSDVVLPADFTANGATLTTTIEYLAPSGLTTAPNTPNPVLVTTNSTIPVDTWPQYVVGTSWAPSQCTVKLANGGSTLCSLFINACFESGTSAAPSDANCPTIATPDQNNYIVLQDKFDWGNGKWIPTDGMTASLIAFTVPTSNPGLQWTPSITSTNPVCPTQTSGSPQPCYLADTLLDIFGDQTTTRGTSPKTKAWLASAVDVPMLTTDVDLSGPGCSAKLNASPGNNNAFAANAWNNGSCVLNFVVNPATSAGSTNFFQAAEPSFLEYGVAQGVVPPPPIQAGALPEGDQTITNPSPILTCDNTGCFATSWPAGPNASLASIFGGDGTYTLHWSAKDTAGITEKRITLTDDGGTTCTPQMALSTICNYLTSYYTTTVNVDSTNPTETLSFSPAGGTYTAGSQVTATFSCDDPLANNVKSGVASCTAVVDGSTPLIPGGTVSTTAGAHKVTVKAVDNAGNTSSTDFPYTATAPSADLAIYEGVSIDFVKHGTTYNYPAWVLDLTKGASGTGVTITGTVTIPTSSLAGTVTGKYSVVTCSLSSGCSAMPAGLACATSSVASGSNTIATVACGPIGTLPNGKGARIQLMIPVSSTAKIGSTFKINATVSSLNDPNSKNNTTTDTITVK